MIVNRIFRYASSSRFLLIRRDAGSSCSSATEKFPTSDKLKKFDDEYENLKYIYKTLMESHPHVEVLLKKLAITEVNLHNSKLIIEKQQQDLQDLEKLKRQRRYLIQRECIKKALRKSNLWRHYLNNSDQWRKLPEEYRKEIELKLLVANEEIGLPDLETDEDFHS